MSAEVEFDRDSLTASVRRSLRDSGNSKVVSFPPQLLQAAGIHESENVLLKADMETGVISVEPVDDAEDSKIEICSDRSQIAVENSGDVEQQHEDSD